MSEPNALFPVDNPEVTDGPGEIPRRADALLRLLLDEFQKLWDLTSAYPKKIDGDDRVNAIVRQVELFAQIYLLGAIRELAPGDANRVAAGLADQLDAGDSLGEWVYQWGEELDAGRPLTLPIQPAPEVSS